jgi:pimeloyl-ACP methyl ester carboxylesterase
MTDQLHPLQVDYNGKSYKLATRLRPASDGLIVFLHGWGCTKESFADAFSSNVLKGYGVCTIDLLGFGESDQPEDFSYDLLDQANIVALAVNSLKAKKIYLVGHSMGGGTGLLAALLIEKLAIFISAEGNLAPRGSGLDARIAAKQPFWLFRSLTLPVLRSFAGIHPDRCPRVWAQWSRKATISPAQECPVLSPLV